MYYKVEAIVLNSYSIRENDLFLILFTKEHGKLVAKVKGAKKERTKYMTSFNALNHVSVELYKKGKNLTIVNSEMIEDFSSFYSDIKKSTYALYICELINKNFEENHEDLNIFKLLLFTLKNIRKNINIYLVLYFFIMKFLYFYGIRPNFSNCIECDKEIRKINDREIGFNLEIGSIECLEHTTMQSMKIYKEVILKLKEIKLSTSKNFEMIEINSRINFEIRNLLFRFLDFHINHNLKCKSVIRELKI